MFRARNAFGDLQSFVEVGSVDKVVASELFASFREWTIGYETFSLAWKKLRVAGDSS